MSTTNVVASQAADNMWYGYDCTNFAEYLESPEGQEYSRPERRSSAGRWQDGTPCALHVGGSAIAVPRSAGSEAILSSFAHAPNARRNIGIVIAPMLACDIMIRKAGEGGYKINDVRGVEVPQGANIASVTNWLLAGMAASFDAAASRYWATVRTAPLQAAPPHGENDDSQWLANWVPSGLREALAIIDELRKRTYESGVSCNKACDVFTALIMDRRGSGALTSVDELIDVAIAATR